MYALSSLKDGERPGWRFLSRREDVLPSEVVVAEPPGEGMVWDGATESLRETTAEEMLEEQRVAKEREAIERFSGLLRQRTGSDTNDFAMSMSIVQFYKAYKAGETPATLEELENLGDLAERKIYEIRTAEDPDSVELP